MLFRVAPLLLAFSYAAVLILVRRLGSPAQVFELAAGYAAAIGGVAAFVAGVQWLRLTFAAARRGERDSALATAGAAIAARWRVDRCLSWWQPLMVFIVTMTAFSLFKQTALPTAGFGMGPAIADADRALLGTDAWRVTHALLPSPWATQAIDLAYHAWFAPMTLGVALCVLATPGAVLAQRYLLAYALLWIVQGSLMAYWLPASGPVYFGHFQAEAGRFADLIARLADQDAALRAAGAPGLTALTFQGYLLRLFGTHGIALGGGISAMPSLHNAMAVLFACAAWRLSRPLGWVLIGYAAVIWIGSVQLGWHFALDGVVALAATLAIWKATGVISYIFARSGTPHVVTVEGEPEPVTLRIS